MPRITGARFVAAVGVRRLLVAGLSLLAISALLLNTVSAGGHFATDLLSALLLAGVAGVLTAPSAQIGALSGVRCSMTGLASGLVETTREIGGAIGVAAVSTVLVSRVGQVAGATGPAARALAAANAFQTAYWVIFAAAFGAITAAIAFPQRTTQRSNPPWRPRPMARSFRSRPNCLPEMRLRLRPADGKGDDVGPFGTQVDGRGEAGHLVPEPAANETARVMTLPGALLRSLAAIVSEPHVLNGDATAGFAVDWTGRFQGHTPAVIRPRDTAEVAAVLALCTTPVCPSSRKGETLA